MKWAVPQILSYPGPLARAGVQVVQETPDLLVITIPSRSILPIAPRHAGIVACVLVAFSVVIRWVYPAVDPDLFTTVGGTLALAILVVSLRGRPTLLRIDAGQFHARFPHNDAMRDRPPPPMPVDAIYRIYYVPHARAVFVRAHGHEMIEIGIEHSETVALALEGLLQQLLLGREPNDLSKPDSPV